MTFDEFVAKYNWRAIDYDGYYGAQCVDLYRQYVKDVLGFPQSPPVAGAADLWNNYNPQYYERINNGLFDIVKRGDIVIWNRNVGGGHGHVAVATSGNLLNFTSFDQNWPVGTYCHYQGHNYTNIYGWLRPKGISTPPPSTNIPTDPKLRQIYDIIYGSQQDTQKILAIQAILPK